MAETIARAYAASLAKLLPIKAQLAATDRLIDQVVYRLYGLTEAEIALVAGRPPNDHAVWYTHDG